MAYQYNSCLYSNNITRQPKDRNSTSSTRSISSDQYFIITSYNNFMWRSKEKCEFWVIGHLTYLYPLQGLNWLQTGVIMHCIPEKCSSGVCFHPLLKKSLICTHCASPLRAPATLLGRSDTSCSSSTLLSWPEQPQSTGDPPLLKVDTQTQADVLWPLISDGAAAARRCCTPIRALWTRRGNRKVESNIRFWLLSLWNGFFFFMLYSIMNVQ